MGPRSLVVLILVLFCLSDMTSIGFTRSDMGRSHAQSIPAGAAEKHILILRSYGYGREGPERYNRYFVSTLIAGGISARDIMVEYLDLNRNQDEEFPPIKRKLLLHQYGRSKLDLIVAVEQPALNFLLDEVKELLKGTPVMAITAKVPEAGLTTSPRFVEKAVNLDFKGTLERALEMFPRTQRVVVVTGTGEQDLTAKSQSQRVAAPWKGRLEFEYTDQLSFDEILKRVADLPPKTIVIFRTFNRDKTGDNFVPYEAVVRIARVANAPVFGLFDNYVGIGVVGGSVYHIQHEAERAAQEALAILNGKMQLTEPVTRLSSQGIPMFDWPQIERWKGKTEALPRDSIIVNRPLTLWGQYKIFVLIALCIILILTCLIAALMIQRRSRRSVEKALRESEERFRVLVEQAPDAILVYDVDLKWFVDANGSAERLFECSRDELIQHGSQWSHEGKESGKRSVAENIADFTERVLAGEEVKFEQAFNNGEGKELICEVCLVRLPSENQRLIRASLTDISERKRAEEAVIAGKREVETILETIQCGVMVIDMDTHEIIDANPAACKLVGAPRDGIVGHVCHTFICPAERGACPITDKGQTVDNSDRILISVKGQHISVVKTATQVMLNGRNCLLESFVDISVRKDAEERLKSSLKEKETLLKEVHHRVKNNMQVISSLLHLQSRYLTDTKAIDAFKASIDRIRSMALVHNKLYQSESLSRIDVSDYAQDLSRDLFNAYSLDNRVSLNMDIDPVSLTIDTVLPLGLLINELLSNSLKHAFPDGRTGRIDVRLTTEGDQLTLAVSDNGIGLPEELDLANAESLGMQLIMTLVEQLDGRVEIDRDRGTQFQINFEAA